MSEEVEQLDDVVTETEAHAVTQEPHVQYIHVEDLSESGSNPRRSFDDAYLEELAESIKNKGVLQPILVRRVAIGPDRFEIIDGACRYRATKYKTNITMLPALVREMDDNQVREAQLVANLQRKDIDPLEEAAAFSALVGITDLATVSARTGKPARYIRERLVLRRLIREGVALFHSKQILLGHAFLLARLPDADQKTAIQWLELRAGEDAPPVSRLQNFILQNFMLTLKRAGWDMADADLVPEAGACSTCPKRTGNEPQLFSDVDAEDTCTDGACYQKKEKTFVNLAMEINEGAAKLSVMRGYDSDPKGLKDWKWIVTAGKNKSKICEHARSGVVVENRITDASRYTEDPRAKLKVGTAVTVCFTMTCKEHWGTRESSESGGYRRSPAEKKADRERKVEIARRGRALMVLAGQPGAGAVSDPELDKVISSLIHGFTNDAARSFVKAMGWVPEKVGAMGADWRGIIRKKVKPSGRLLLLHWLVVITAAKEDAWMMPGSKSSSTVLLDAAMKQRKLVLLPLDEKPKKGAAHAAAKTKTKAESASA